MKKFWLIFLFLVICRLDLQAAVTYDASSTGKCGSSVTPACNITTNLTVSHTTGAGSNRSMSVFVKIDCDSGSTAPTVSSVQYAGSQNLTQTLHVSAAARRIYDLWSLPAGTQPTSGANNLVVTLSGNIEAVCAGASKMDVTVLTAAGVDQTTTYTSSNTGNNGNSASASVTLSSSGANDLVIFGACAGSHFTGGLTGTGGSVKQQDDDDTLDCASDIVATFSGGVTTPTAAISASDSWQAVAASLKDASGSPPPAVGPRHMLLHPVKKEEN